MPVACARREAAPEYSAETWVAIGTGSTVKWPQTICTGFVRPRNLPDDFTDLDQLSSRGGACIVVIC